MLATRGVATFELAPREALELGCGTVVAAGVFKTPFVEVLGTGVMVLGDCSAPDGAEA